MSEATTDEDAATAAGVMLENKYGCLPVLEQGALVGILTEADFVRFVAEAPADVAPARDVARSKHGTGRR